MRGKWEEVEGLVKIQAKDEGETKDEAEVEKTPSCSGLRL